MNILKMFSSKDEQSKKDQILKKESIVLNADSVTKEEAIEMAGKLLVDAGYVAKDYIKAMKEREGKVSTYMGNGVAIPHGTSEAKKYIKKSGISFIQFPKGVDFGDGNTCYLLIGIAGKGDEHIDILQNLAEICQDSKETDKLVKTTSKDFVINNLV